jgi:hypothetical protein
MMARFKIGDRVTVVDVRPNVEAVIEAVSTWDKVTGTSLKGDCYLVKAAHWAHPVWIGVHNLWPIKSS